MPTPLAIHVIAACLCNSSGMNENAISLTRSMPFNATKKSSDQRIQYSLESFSHMRPTLTQFVHGSRAESTGAERIFGIRDHKSQDVRKEIMAEHAKKSCAPHERDSDAGFSSLTGFFGVGEPARHKSQRRWGVDFSALRRLAPMAAVLEVLGWTPVSKRGPQLRGRCPIHKSSSEKSRNFSANLEKNAFQCFGCGKKGNQLDLFSKATGLPLSEAAWTLAERLAIDPALIEKRKP